MRFWFPFLLMFVAALSGCKAPSFLVTPVSASVELEESTVQDGRGIFPDKVLIIELEGMILNTRTGGLFQAQENDVSLITQQLNMAAQDPSVKAVILRINSPGGTVSASDALYEQIRRFRAQTHRPVIAFGQDLMASGAYYTACSADRIMCQPTSIVGSIGVIFESFDVSRTMDWLGIRANAVKSAPMKDMGSPFKPLGEPERQVMQGMVDEFFARFKGIVADARKLQGERLQAVSDGRVFTGEQAQKLGLIDKTGTLNDAIEAAQELGHCPGAAVVIYRRPHGYSGSIYARGMSNTPQAVQIQLVPGASPLPTGFYYLWNP